MEQKESQSDGQESSENLKNSAETEQTDEEALAQLESEQSETSENQATDEEALAQWESER